MNNFTIYFLLWFPMVIIAIVNGTIREKFFRKFLSELHAHQLSTLTALLLFALYFWFITGRWKLDSSMQALLIGAMWFAMTVLFEFVFGHFVMNHSWQKLFNDYNFFDGRLWIFILIWTLIGLYVTYIIRN
ncbi:MAG: hypothetical protein K8H86_01760 [Ignavibacteriaceae bacterium]|nr:hypothetical protein [Ignavibacteriaceae bacterium]